MNIDKYKEKFLLSFYGAIPLLGSIGLTYVIVKVINYIADKEIFDNYAIFIVLIVSILLCGNSIELIAKQEEKQEKALKNFSYCIYYLKNNRKMFENCTIIKKIDYESFNVIKIILKNNDELSISLNDTIKIFKNGTYVEAIFELDEKIKEKYEKDEEEYYFHIYLNDEYISLTSKNRFNKLTKN